MAYPLLNVNLKLIESNARAVCGYYARLNIRVAGVVKFSDGDFRIAQSYLKGGCEQIASSRVAHLAAFKERDPGLRTLLLRIPMLSELEDAARCCDYILVSERKTLIQLNSAAERIGKKPGIIVMMDTGDQREGVQDEEELFALCSLCETRLGSIELKGIGTSYACANGVLPEWDSLKRLADAAEDIERCIGRKLEIVSGGSSINTILPAGGREIPGRINHLRIGGLIANPIGMRRNRGVVIPGMSEDTMRLDAEIVEIKERDTDLLGTQTKNWSGDPVQTRREGRRKRAILALGSQDIGDADKLLPLDDTVRVIACSSDHLIVDITESGEYGVGDVISFQMLYGPLLQCFATRHVHIRYI